MLKFHIQNAIALRQLLSQEENQILKELGISDTDDADYIGDRLSHLDDLITRASYDSSFTSEDLLEEFNNIGV